MDKYYLSLNKTTCVINCYNESGSIILKLFLSFFKNLLFTRKFMALKFVNFVTIMNFFSLIILLNNVYSNVLVDFLEIAHHKNAFNAMKSSQIYLNITFLLIEL